MKEEKLRQALEGCRLPAWESIPDFGLYMDQLLTYTERALPSFPGLTAAMINNYVKAGIMNRPEGKKYSREAIARLLMICVLKQTLSQENIKKLLYPAENREAEALYHDFRAAQDRMVGLFASRAPESALTCALESAFQHLICGMMLAEEGAGGET